MSDERMPPQQAHVEAFLESLADVAVPGELAGSVSAHIRERPSRRPSFRLPLLAAAAGLLLTVSVAMAAGWKPPFDILPGPQASVTLPPVASAEPSPSVPAETWEWATLVAQNVEAVVDPVTLERAGAGPTDGKPSFESVLVLGRRVVDGRTWVHIEQGGGTGEARFVWIPETVPSVAPTGYDVFTLEHTTWLPCQDGVPATVDAVATLTPAQRLACYGGGSLTLGPAKVVPTWDDTANTGTPDWLAGPITTTLQAAPDPLGNVWTVPVRLKPGTGIALLPDAWVTVTAHFDDAASATCEREATQVSGAPVGEPSDHVLWCRQQLVIDGASVVSEPTRASPPPGLYPDLVGVKFRLPDAPIEGRVGESAAWTGSELVIWGGAHRGQVGGSGDLPADGAALDVQSGTWRAMSASPLSGRSDAVSAWTGREMVVWGGSSTADASWLSDGAAWNPTTDSWRTLAPAPLKGGFPQLAAWDGSRWYVASGKGLAAYDPQKDAWTRLADLPVGTDDVVRMAWAGDRLALLTQSLSGADLWTLRPGDPAWAPLGQAPIGDVPVHGMVFDGSRLWVIGTASTDPAGPVLGEWDPAAGSWGIIDSPVDTGDAAALWNGTQVMVVGAFGAVFEPGSQSWLMLPDNGNDRLRETPTVVWAGDRLIVWGGAEGEAVSGGADGWQMLWPRIHP